MRPVARLQAAAAADQTNFTWLAPQANETLLAGQNYIARWSASSSPQAQAFQLCVYPPTGNVTAEGSCGGWVTAPVQHGDGLYFVSLSLPNVSSTDPFILKMHDNPNADFISPSFFIHSASMANSSSPMNATSSSSDNRSMSEAPGLSFQLPQSSNNTDPLVLLMPSASQSLIGKRDLQDIMPRPTPLFIVFSIIPVALLVGGLLTFVLVWFRQRRNGQMKRLYLTEHPMIYPRRPLPKSLNSGEDLEDAVQTLSYERLRSEKASAPVSDDPAKHKSDVISNRLKRRERRGEDEELGVRGIQGRVAAPAGPRALPPYGHPSDPSKPFKSTLDNSSRESYVPQPRNLTESYFPVLPPLDLSSHVASNTAYSQMGVYGITMVESPIGMSPPPPSVTKLSERLHLRHRSESTSRSPKGMIRPPQQGRQKDEERVVVTDLG